MTFRFIIEDRDYHSARSRFRSVFLPAKSFPSQIFQSHLTQFSFEEFDWVMESSFWGQLQELTLNSRDSDLLIGVIDPVPDEYFKHSFGYYNWAEISVDSTSDDYWELLNQHPDRSEVDSIYFNSNEMFWIPQSSDWGVWASRSLGLCVLAESKPDTDNTNLKSLDWALEVCLPSAFKNGLVPPDFLSEMRVNFTNHFMS